MFGKLVSLFSMPGTSYYPVIVKMLKNPVNFKITEIIKFLKCVTAIYLAREK